LVAVEYIDLYHWSNNRARRPVRVMTSVTRACWSMSGIWAG
jgi:hypothetical protein